MVRLYLRCRRARGRHSKQEGWKIAPAFTVFDSCQLLRGNNLLRVQGRSSLPKIGSLALQPPETGQITF